MGACDDSAARGGARAATIEVDCRPLLESWEGRNHAAQQRLRAYEAKLAELAAPALQELTPPLALGFHVANRDDLESGCDLDNFLTPVVRALGGPAVFSVVWATRGRASERARITLARAADADALRPTISGDGDAFVRTTVSPDRHEWKEQIAAAVGRHSSAGRSGPIELGIQFTLSPLRNWMTPWKPAIDALSGILGLTDPMRRWHPRDDRIALLVLERELDADLGWAIELRVRWRES